MRSRVRTKLTKNEQIQQFIRIYKEETHEHEVDLHKAAQYALDHGWQPPRPTSIVDILAHQFADALRIETKDDKTTGRPYRVNHAYANGQTTFWFDIDDPETTRTKMQISLINRREQMVGDGVQLTFDADHWNAMHPEEKRIVVSMDFTEDIAERKASDD